MDMLVNDAGDHLAALEVHHFGAGIIEVDMLCNVHDFVIADENIGLADVFRGIDIAVFQKTEHSIKSFLYGTE